MKRYLIVTIILQTPEPFDYGPIFDYVHSFDWKEAVAPTATNRSVCLFTEKPEKEIRQHIQQFLTSDDYCSVCSYDSAEGPQQIAAHALALAEWVSR